MKKICTGSAIVTQGFFQKVLVAFAFIFILNFHSASAQFKVIGYLPTWGGNLADVQFTKLTHINYAFLIPNANGTYQAPDDPTRLKNLVSMAHANGVKVVISVGGGGGGDAFKTIVTTAALRTTFVNNMVAFTNQYNIDGVDIDWEFPNTGTEANNLVLMMQQLYNAMHPLGKLTTMAVVSYGGTSILNGLFPYVDFLNIMAYDENSYDHSTYDLGVKSVNYWVGRGLPASKAILGVPFYGRDNCCDYKTVDYSAILAMGGSAQADTYNNEIGYNGIPTMKKKTAYAMGACGGIMIWSIDTDAKGANSLLSAINEVVLANGGASCGTVTSSTDDGNVAANVLDKNLTTRWSASGDGQWIKFCLGRDSIPVNKISIAFYSGDTRVSTFDIQVSHDGTTWTNALTGAKSSGTGTALETFTFPLQYTKFLRILGHGNSVNVFNSFTEVGLDTAHVAYTTANKIPGIIQAENYDLGGEGVAYHDATATDDGSGFRTNDGVDLEATTDAGAGYNLGWTAAGEWINYTVTVATARNYTFGFRSAGTTAGSVKLIVDGTTSTSAVALPNTGAYQTWTTTTAPASIALSAGTHTITLNIAAGGFNLNYIEFKTATTTGIEELNLSQTLSVYPNPAADEINIAGQLNGNVEISLIDQTGRVVLTQHAASVAGNISEKVNVAGFTSGLYLLKVAGNNDSKIIKIIIQ